MGSANLEKYFEKLMNDYYLVLINAWDSSLRVAARTAIKSLSDVPKHQRVNEEYLKALEYTIRGQLGEDFAYALDSKVKTFSELCYKLSSQESQFNKIKFSFTPTDYRNIEMIKKQQVFWLKEHYSGSVSDRLSDILSQSIENKWTRLELSKELQTHFSDLYKGGKPYFEGLAEHTSLRVREFARLTNYQKCGVKYYQIVAVMDERTSDICRALNGKIFKVADAIETMEEMFNVSEITDVEEAKARLNQLAPFVKDSQIVYDSDEVPIGIDGNHTIFPPFHWRCRTRTIMLTD
jgi:SPP1 gp7 family putative phage head morphogenesis protein